MNVNGYEIKERTENSNQFSGDKIIYWWNNDDYIKCDGYSPLEYYAIGSGYDLEDSINSIMGWFQSLDKDDEREEVTIQDLLDSLKDFDKDLKIKIKTDCGVLSIDSIDDTNDTTIYINTE